MNPVVRFKPLPGVKAEEKSCAPRGQPWQVPRLEGMTVRLGAGVSADCSAETKQRSEGDA